MALKNKPFCILSAPGSGADLLISSLLATGKVLVGWAPFNTAAFGGFDVIPNFDIHNDALLMMNDPKWRDADPESYIEFSMGLTADLDDAGIEAIGFAIFPAHDYLKFYKFSFDDRFNHVLMQRRSVVTAFAEVSTAGKKSKVTFDADEFEKFRAQYLYGFEKAISNLVDHGVNKLEDGGAFSYCHMFYEDLVSDRRAFPAVLDFIGVSGVSHDGPLLAKPCGPDILSRFSNPSVVRPYLEAEIGEQKPWPPIFATA